MNRVNLIGRTVKDITVIEGKDQEWICARFTLAVDDGPAGKDTKERKAQFIDCVAWNEQADILERYVKKGNIVALEGRLTQNNYKDEGGIMHYRTEVTVARVELLPNPEKKEEKEEAPKKYGRKEHR